MTLEIIAILVLLTVIVLLSALSMKLHTDRNNNIIREAGTFTVLPELGGLHGYGGDIVKIEYLGRKWEP